MVKYKGFKYLIKASKYLDANTKIIIAGDGKEFENLKEIIVKNNLEKKVFLLKKIPHQVHLSYLKLCKVFCLPSIDRNEAFGIVLIEAMTFSKPLISTIIKGSGINLLNVNEIMVLVPVKNPKKLGFNILKILKEVKKYKKCQLILKKIFKVFTSSLMNKSFYELYKMDYESIKK